LGERPLILINGEKYHVEFHSIAHNTVLTNTVSTIVTNLNRPGAFLGFSIGCRSGLAQTDYAYEITSAGGAAFVYGQEISTFQTAIRNNTGVTLNFVIQIMLFVRD